MSVERTTPSTSGRLVIETEPGTFITADSAGDGRGGVSVTLAVSGTLGVRFLSTLIEEATALRDELRDVIG